MNLWIDDDKPAPEGWAVAKSYGAAVDLLRRFTYDTIAIDHDLGDDDSPTGYDILCMMERGDLPRPKAICVISWNAVGAKRMLAALAQMPDVTNLGWDLQQSVSGWSSENRPKVGEAP